MRWRGTVADTEASRFRPGLRARLLVLVALALSPIFVLAAIQAWIDGRNQQEILERELAASARLLAHDQELLIRGTEELMITISSIPEVANLGAGCNNAMARITQRNRAYTNFAIFDLDGEVVCSAASMGAQTNFADTDWFQGALAAQDFVIGNFRIGVSTGEPVLVTALPFYQEGEIAGVMATGIRVSMIQQLGIRRDDAEDGLIAGIVDRSGTVITERTQLRVDNVDPAFLERADLGQIVVFERESDDTGVRTLAVASLIEGDIYVLLSAPKPSLLSWALLDVSSTFVLPLLMWLLALIAIWIATDHLILRWLSYLGRIARLYGLGRYEIVPVRAERAPREIRELADSFQWMATRIAERDEDLNDAIEYKQTLIREVHHRVKNNLQIVTSLLNLQLGNVADPEAVSALREAQARINALAMVHRNLYEAEDLRFIRIEPFLTELCRLTHEAGPGHKGPVRLDFQSSLKDRVISTDEAVPLSMFITEAMTNAYKHAFPDRNADNVLTIKLDEFERGDDVWIETLVADNGVGLSEAERRQGVGSSLFEAFAIQLEGEFEIDGKPNEGVRIALRFPLEHIDAGAEESSIS
nr:sensor histidine kinase [Hyphobacterium sp. SN044]